jgi:hypothetical protein
MRLFMRSSMIQQILSLWRPIRPAWLVRKSLRFFGAPGKFRRSRERLLPRRNNSKFTKLTSGIRRIYKHEKRTEFYRKIKAAFEGLLYRTDILARYLCNSGGSL